MEGRKVRGRPRPHPGAVQGLNCGRGRPRTTADGRSSAPAIRITLDRQDDRQYNLERSDRDWGQTPPVRQRCIVSNRDDGELQVKFKGPATRGHSVPVEVLTASLESLQKVVHLLARRRHDEPGTDSGASVPAEIRHRYSLICRLPTAGSYTVPITLSDSLGSQSDYMPDLSGDLQHLFRAVQNQDESDLEWLFPAPRTRAAVSRALYDMVPKPRSGARLIVQSHSGRDIFVPDSKTGRFLKSLTGSPADHEVGRSVAGHLKEIDFDKRRIRLEHPPTGRQLTCSYPRQLEHMLVDWRRNLIQVLGEVTTGPDDIPKRIRSVDDIHLVDLSPIELREFITQGRRVRAREPIVFEPAMDDAYQHYVVRDGPFGIRLISLTRGDLETNLNEEMDVLWRHYACADDAKLTRAAQQLKQQLNGAFHPR